MAAARWIDRYDRRPVEYRPRRGSSRRRARELARKIILVLGAGLALLVLLALTACAPATRTICVSGEGASVAEVMPSPWWAGETAATVAWAQGADGATSGTVTVTRDKRTINSLGLSAISAVAGYLAAGVP